MKTGKGLSFLAQVVLLVRHGFRDWRTACAIYGKILREESRNKRGDFRLSSIGQRCFGLADFPSIRYLSCDKRDSGLLDENEEFGEKPIEQLIIERAAISYHADPVELAARLFNYWCAKEFFAVASSSVLSVQHEIFTWRIGRDYYGKMLQLIASDEEYSAVVRSHEFASALRVFSGWYDRPHPITGMFAVLSDWTSPRGVIRATLHRAWYHAQVLSEMFDL